jgi:hypothetical protein
MIELKLPSRATFTDQGIKVAFVRSLITFPRFGILSTREHKNISRNLIKDFRGWLSKFSAEAISFLLHIAVRVSLFFSSPRAIERYLKISRQHLRLPSTVKTIDGTERLTWKIERSKLLQFRNFQRECRV